MPDSVYTRMYSQGMNLKWNEPKQKRGLESDPGLMYNESIGSGFSIVKGKTYPCLLADYKSLYIGLNAIWLKISEAVLHYSQPRLYLNSSHLPETFGGIFSLRKCLGDSSFSCFFFTSVKGVVLNSVVDAFFFWSALFTAPFDWLSASVGCDFSLDIFWLFLVKSEFLFFACCNNLLACSLSLFLRSSSC